MSEFNFPPIPQAVGGPPPPAPFQRESDGVGRMLRISVIAHVLILGTFLIQNVFFPSTPKRFLPTLRVDLVGLPDLLKAEKQKLTMKPPAATPQEEPAPKVKPKPMEVAQPDEMVLNPKKAEKAREKEEAARKKRQESALARLKALSKIEGEPDPTPEVIKGNKISKGTSLSADAVEAAEASYFDLVRERLQSNWALPVWIARQNLQAQITITIDARGVVTGLRFNRPSGNATFDQAVRKAVSDSQPFPAPTAEIASGVAREGIVVGFPL